MVSATTSYRNTKCPYELECARLRQNFVQQSCYYYCCAGGKWYRGMFSPGTRCKLQPPRRGIGQCLRGVCTSSSGGGIPSQPSRPFPSPPETLPSCNEIVSTVGYITSCSYSCRSSSGGMETSFHAGGTPCIELNEQGTKPNGPAGLCSGAKCIPYYDIDGDAATVSRKVFPGRLSGCPEKPFLGRMAVSDCHYYCKLEGYWFYGSYTSNTTCQTENPNLLGWCCHGYCHHKMWCGRNENSLDYSLQ